ncbi:MAG: hypothetical protein JW913_07305 [Chitinispirillaceae bacterium]|nr:hypothetical protein [Chitinispirillaceae bacterium]
MFRQRMVLLTLSLLACTVVAPLARSIMEKKMFYITTTGKTGQARFWAIYLGNHDCKLTRKAPGQAEKQIVASVNLHFLSSGYVEGNGYGVSGKVQSLPTMEIRDAAGERRISIDSIDFIYDHGTKVALKGGARGDFVINVEGDKKMATRFLMREYKLTMYFGEEILKEGSDETAISAIAFSKDGIARARTAQAQAEQGQSQGQQE